MKDEPQFVQGDVNDDGTLDSADTHLRTGETLICAKMTNADWICWLSIT